MPKSKTRKKKPPKRVLAIPDLEQAKTAVLNSLTSAGKRAGHDQPSLAAIRRIAYEAADAGLLSPELAAGIHRVKGVRRIGELDQIQFLLGHVSIQTTERYLGCKQHCCRDPIDSRNRGCQRRLPDTSWW